MPAATSALILTLSIPSDSTEPDQSDQRSTGASADKTRQKEQAGDDDESITDNFVNGSQSDAERRNDRRRTTSQASTQSRLSRWVCDFLNQPTHPYRKALKKCSFCNAATFLVNILLLFIILVLIFPNLTRRFNCTNVQHEPASIMSSTPQPSFIDDGQRTTDWIHLAIDMAAVPPCKKYQSRAEPCRNHTAYITPNTDVVRPLRCVDDAYMENETVNPNSCTVPSNTFELLGDEGKVRVTRPGTYQIVVHITARLPEMSQVHFGIAVNGKHLAFLCTVQSYGISMSRQAVPYSHCSIHGMRRLRPGDTVNLFVSDGGICMQSLYRSTFMQLARIGS